MKNEKRIPTAHEIAVNCFIPEAWARACAEHPGTAKQGEMRAYTTAAGEKRRYLHRFRTEAFHREMNRITVKAALRIP